MTPSSSQNGDAALVTPGETTPVRSSRLSDEHASFLARIKRTRAQGFLLTVEDQDILLRIVEELLQ
jgi:hypothetical protein